MKVYRVKLSEATADGEKYYLEYVPSQTWTQSPVGAYAPDADSIQRTAEDLVRPYVRSTQEFWMVKVYRTIIETHEVAVSQGMVHRA